MTTFNIFLALASLSLLARCLAQSSLERSYAYCGPIKTNDKDGLQFGLNFQFLEAEFFLHGATGHGLDYFEPEFAQGGPPPVGAQKANLDPLTYDIIRQFGYQESGHLRATIRAAGGVKRPLLDLSRQNFAKFFDGAVGYKLNPPFDPYCDSIHYLLSCYMFPYFGVVGTVGLIPQLSNYATKRLVAGILGAKAGQDAIIRTLLYQRAYEKVHPYNITVAEFTNGISKLGNTLSKCPIQDEGLIVPPYLGAENKTRGNILSLNTNSLAYAVSPPAMLRMIYGTGSEHKPGGFLPQGANGKIARSYLGKA